MFETIYEKNDMNKFISVTVLILSLGCYDTSSKYKEPSYTLIKKLDKIEFREYDENIIIKTSKSNANGEANNSLFRILASYIFGGNKKNEKIPMTAPVITTNIDNNHEMIFFILNKNTSEDLPIPNSTKIQIDNLNLNKTISISFGMWATEKRIKYYKKLLDKYIFENSINIKPNLMVAQYNSPWVVPPFRRNELIYQIKE